MISFVDRPLTRWFRDRRPEGHRPGDDAAGRPTVVLWPDYTPEPLQQALNDFANRGRRYGGR